MAAVSVETYAVWLASGVLLSCLAVYVTLTLWKTSFLLLETYNQASDVLRFSQGLQWLQKALFQRRKIDAFEHKVRQLATAAKLERACNMCRAFVHIVAAVGLYVVFSFGYYDFERFKDVRLARWELHQTGLVNTVLYFVVTLFTWLLPSWTTMRFLHASYVAAIVRISWQTFTAGSVQRFFALGLLSSGVRVMCAWLVHTPSLTLGLNLICSLASVWRFSHLNSSLSAVEQETVQLVFGGLGGLMIRELFLCGSTCCLSSIMESGSLATARAKLEVQMSSTGAESVRCTLAVLCDAVVTVDKDLLFSAPRHAACAVPSPTTERRPCMSIHTRLPGGSR
eukprot:TRINITY_DN102879_c0_g1_i1.p1 TRINITY_DN102879_c0_g1~~TRINITY_DN102879_c0_g1_i1.p1  ORF type:complete len:339 (-),score=32.84 TRINITY_DN102879_c0_g1_i1:772-1788(-)